MVFSFEKTQKKLGQFQPIGRAGTPEDIAKMVAFVIDNDQASFVTGSYFLADGGLSAIGFPTIEDVPYFAPYP